MRKVVIAGAALAMLGVAGTAIGESHMQADVGKAIEARESLMHLYGFHLGTLGGMARGNMDYDADTAQLAADNLAALAALDQSQMWPEGSDQMSTDDTRALPAIWEDRADFDAKAEALTQATASLAEVAGTDLAALQGAMGGVGEACGACHKAYRAPEN